MAPAQDGTYEPYTQAKQPYDKWRAKLYAAPTSPKEVLAMKRMSLTISSWLAGVLACLLLSLPAAAQTSSTGAVQGTVTDSQGAVVAGADVKLLDPATNRSQIEKTSEAGLYIFVNVPPGSYTVTAAKTGFRMAQ